MSSLSLPVSPSFADPHGRDATKADDEGRLRELVDTEHAFVWRSLRRLGVAMSDVDDAVQKVFLVAAGRLQRIPPGRERAFLFATAVRVASTERRAWRRKRSAGPEPLDAMVSPAPSPEQVASDRARLDSLLESLSVELRSVVILYELEQCTIEEIGEMLDLPAGTVASRLRRARELLDAAVKRARAQERRQP